jgi:hypothetical protein
MVDSRGGWKAASTAPRARDTPRVADKKNRPEAVVIVEVTGVEPVTP